VEEEISAEILLPVEAMLPSFYITDEQERISVYQKLAGSEDEAILKEFEEDLHDEFGEPPQPVKNLFAVLKLKLVCRQAGVIRIKMQHEAREDFVVLTLAGRVTAKEIMQLLKENPQWKISGSNLNLPFNELLKKAGTDESKWLAELTKEVGSLIGEKRGA